MNDLVWWTGISPLRRQLATPFRGVLHYLEWSEGELRLVDHDDETLALEALTGDQTCWCARVALTWREVTRDPEVLAYAPRSDEDPLDPQLGRSVREALGRARSMGAADARLALGIVLSLGPPMTHRLQATAIARTLERWGDDRFRAAHEARMVAALYGRAKPAIARSLAAARLPPLRRLVLDVGDVALTREVVGDGTVVRAALPITWLRDVWARERAIHLSGRLVTGVSGIGEDGKIVLETHDWHA